MLDGVFRALQWQGAQHQALDHAESNYTALLAGLIGRDLAQLEQAEPRRAADILELLSAADTATLRRVLLAPETSCRLLWKNSGGRDGDTWSFLADALDVEFQRLADAPARVRTGASSSVASSARWSALGDFYIDDAGPTIVSQPPLAGIIVDADSPAAISLDVSLLDAGISLRHYTDPAAKETALRKVEAAMLALHVMEPGMADFVRRSTLVANVVTDDEGSRFSSGSTDQYVGRSIFWNAHLPSVDIEALAEALVHEAIHSLLYMHEVREPWFLSEALFSSDLVVQSPWTGSSLRLEPFMQACFVWFGLAHFWTAARRGSPFQVQKLEARLATARHGFLSGPLLTQISEYLPQIEPSLIELLRAMQKDVVSRSAFAGSC